MKVDLSLELWEAVIVAIDNDLNDFRDCGTEGSPELDIRYGKMLQARGEILCKKQDRYVENKDLKILLDFMLDYGGTGSLPNMDEGGSGDLAYEAAERLAKDNEPELLTYWINTHEKCRTGRAKSKGSTMPKFKVTATMDVGYEAVVEAPNEEAAWDIAADSGGDGTVDWVQVDNGHDWTLENVYEVSDDGC